ALAEDRRPLRRRHRDRAAPRRRGGHRRQAQLRRVRHGLVDRELRPRRHAESLGWEARPGRLLGWLGRGGCRARVPRRPRNRYGRLDPPPRRVLRRRRAEAHLWPRLAAGGPRPPPPPPPGPSPPPPTRPPPPPPRGGLPPP